LAEVPLAPSARKVRPHKATKTKKSNSKKPKTRRKGKEEEKIELDGITTYVYQKSFKPKPIDD
jgi:hypothetical protein